MPTDWLNMPELPRDVRFPSIRRRVGVFVLYVFTLSCAVVVWRFFVTVLVALLLRILMWPFRTTRWVVGALPPFEGTPGPSGERQAVAAVYWDSAANALQEASQNTVGQLQSDMLTWVMSALFHVLLAANLHVWLCKQFRLAQMDFARMTFAPPLLWWRTALSALVNVVAVYSAFTFVHSRLSRPPSGDSSGGIEAFLYMVSETLEMLAGWVHTVLHINICMYVHICIYIYISKYKYICRYIYIIYVNTYV